MSQLTINLDENLLLAAQAYARAKGQDLDALVAQMLQAAVGPLTARPVTSAPARPLSPRIQRLFGAVSVRQPPSYFSWPKKGRFGFM